MAPVTDPDAPFTLSSLISEAGVASNGEKLVNSLTFFYPPELKAALEKRENPDLLDRFWSEHTDTNGKVDRLALAREASKVADQKVLHATIRGGEYAEQDAMVTYVYYDDRGDAIKGAFPYEDLGKTSSRGHISQLAGLASSPAARDHESAQSKARAAAAEAAESESAKEADALRAELEEAQAKLAEQSDPEPVKDYGKANATDIATMVGAADRGTAERVLEYERAHANRSTVTGAVEKRIRALDDEDQAAADAAAAQATELEAARARIAELEAQAAQPPQAPSES